MNITKKLHLIAENNIKVQLLPKLIIIGKFVSQNSFKPK